MILSAQDARGPEDYERAWRPAVQLSERIVLAVVVALQQRHLQEGENQGQREAEEHLAGDPGVGREAAPHHLVDRRQDEEEQRPADGELPPTLVGELEGGAEDRLEQRPAEE